MNREKVYLLNNVKLEYVFLLCNSDIATLSIPCVHQVLFNDTKYREGMVVTKNNNVLFKCFDGVDHIDKNKTRQQNFKFKTCSISGRYLSFDSQGIVSP